MTDDALAPIRAWLLAFAARVRARDFDGGRAMCLPDMIAFGTFAPIVRGIDHVMDEQWKAVWPTIREFTIRAERAEGAVVGEHAWVAAPWDSLGVRPDGTTFPRPGRCTIVLEQREGRWLARHTHFSLAPGPSAP